MSAKQCLVMTETQVQYLECKKQDDEASGEIESHYPGYLGSQDTFYGGPSKVWGASISKSLWIPTLNERQPNSIPPRHLSPRLTF